MKISSIKTYLAKEWRTFLFVVVETDDGTYGLGEAGLTGRELAVQGAIEHFNPLLLGQDPSRTEHLWQMLWRGGFYPAGQVLSSAIAAIDMALWDLKAKALDTPLYQLLGGRCRDRVLTYNHLGSGSVEQVASQAERSVAEGWKCLRFELWPEHHNAGFEPRKAIRQSLKHWAAIREAVGDDIEICVDVHTRLGVADAVRYCRATETFRPFFIEDPLRSENPQSYRHLRQQTAAPLAAGEQYAGKWDFKHILEEELVDFARIDVAIAGGITEARKIAAMAETHYIDIAVHNPIGPVSTAACLHLNLACTNFGVMELPRRPGETMADVITGQPIWENGFLLVPEKPGLGVEFDPEALQKYPFEMTELPHLHREDGSFTNW